MPGIVLSGAPVFKLFSYQRPFPLFHSVRVLKYLVDHFDEFQRTKSGYLSILRTF